MSKIRMNTEFRNKILNRYVESAETETTQPVVALFLLLTTIPSRRPSIRDNPTNVKKFI